MTPDSVRRARSALVAVALLASAFTPAHALRIVDWNVTNSDGDNVASGVYIYQIKNSFSEKRGKLIIVR